MAQTDSVLTRCWFGVIALSTSLTALLLNVSSHAQGSADTYMGGEPTEKEIREFKNADRPCFAQHTNRLSRDYADCMSKAGVDAPKVAVLTGQSPYDYCGLFYPDRTMVVYARCVGDVEAGRNPFTATTAAVTQIPRNPGFGADRRIPPAGDEPQERQMQARFGGRNPMESVLQKTKLAADRSCSQKFGRGAGFYYDCMTAALTPVTPAELPELARLQAIATARDEAATKLAATDAQTQRVQALAGIATSVQSAAAINHASIKAFGPVLTNAQALSLYRQMNHNIVTYAQSIVAMSQSALSGKPSGQTSGLDLSSPQAFASSSMAVSDHEFLNFETAAVEQVNRTATITSRRVLHGTWVIGLTSIGPKGIPIPEVILVNRKGPDWTARREQAGNPQVASTRLPDHSPASHQSDSYECFHAETGFGPGLSQAPIIRGLIAGNCSYQRSVGN